MTEAVLSAAVVEHHLKLLGVDPSTARISLRADDAAPQGVTVVLMPSRTSCAGLGVDLSGPFDPPAVLRAPGAPAPRARLRTLHPYHVLERAGAEPVVVDEHGRPVWLWLPRESGGTLLLGSDLAGDLVRYRQGDPTRAAARQVEPVWDIAGERPLYLFESQLEGEAPEERHADWWAMALATTLADKAGVPRAPILPGGAPGAVVITGDDDQAALACYDAQLALLDGAPITYFLHPQTKHTAATLQGMRRRFRVDLGLHPDALDAPERYAKRLAAQARWFRRLVGRPALSVRNHGFLNDGYWGHLTAWRQAGIRLSANLPGVDGRVLNSSLLPGRIAFDGELTEHWSIVTAIGDGVRFALGMSEDDSAECILRLGRVIEASGVPGIVVLNLHPENVGTTREMHLAARALLDRGFHAWTLAECLDWFERRDGLVLPTRPQPLWSRLFAGARA